MIRSLPLLVAFLLAGCNGDDPTPESPFTQERLANLAYGGIADTTVQLRDGRWEGEPYVAGGASRPSAGLAPDFLLTGDLDGDGSDEAVVVLWQSSGGSGTFNHVAVVDERNGELRNLATAPLGDRVKTRDGRIVDGRIELDVLQQDNDDAACCPTQLATRTWVLFDGTLNEQPARITGNLETDGESSSRP